MFIFPFSEARKKKRVMKVPKGTSDYQATWIVDEDENGELDEESSEEEEEDDDEMLDEAMDEEDEDMSSQVILIFNCKYISKYILLVYLFLYISKEGPFSDSK